MRFYAKTHKHTCGIDLHARSMYLCVLDEHDQVVLHKDLPTDPAVLVEALSPFREDLVIGVECMFSWYWLADLCSREGIPFVLGHALYMGAIHGDKSKTDRIEVAYFWVLRRFQVTSTPNMRAAARPVEKSATPSPTGTSRTRASATIIAAQAAPRNHILFLFISRSPYCLVRLTLRG
jgi:hypothetical protein